MNKYVAMALTLAVLCPSAAAQRKKKNDDEDTQKPAVWVQNMDKVRQMDSGCFVYALPRTVLRMTVEVERHIFTAGPYAAYAEKYLGVADTRTVGSTRYHIKSTALTSYVEADAQHLYMVRPVSAMSFNFLTMTRDGLMLLPETIGKSASGSNAGSFAPDEQQLFTSMAIDAMFHTVKPKLQSKKPDADSVNQEESLVEVEEPVSLLQQAKTQEERASEVAHFIFNLRKRKYELITGEVDIAFSSNDGLKVALTEINRMESEYISLFIGKTLKQVATYTYDIAPTPTQGSYTVFTFSPEHGVQEVDGQGDTVTLELQPENKYTAVNLQPADEDNSSFKVRLPDVALVRLLNEKGELQRGRFRIYQNGKIVNVRAEHFIGK
ncbi:MAG: DUF4831 family protein [Prevotellaceae bacterium]|jgi:hypothetical protein|nr:DUF4831 family protein [Prevotellaceae bacterium]